MNIGHWAHRADVGWCQLMADSRTKRDKVAGTVCEARALYWRAAGNPWALPARGAVSATLPSQGIPGGQRGAGAMQKPPASPPRGSGCNCPASSWGSPAPAAPSGLPWRRPAGPSRSAPQNAALAGTSLDGDRRFKTELESPQGLHRAEGGGSGFYSPELLLPAPGVHLVCKNVSRESRKELKSCVRTALHSARMVV